MVLGGTGGELPGNWRHLGENEGKIGEEPGGNWGKLRRLSVRQYVHYCIKRVKAQTQHRKKSQRAVTVKFLQTLNSVRLTKGDSDHLILGDPKQRVRFMRRGPSGTL